MINPKDIERLENKKDKKIRKELDPEFIKEFENGKGEDEEDA